MNPTGPIDTKRSPTAPSVRTVGAGAARPAASGSSTAASGGAPPAVVDTKSGGAIEAARSETHRLDASKLDELADRIESGNYHVDPSALADRILDDALGPEVSG